MILEKFASAPLLAAAWVGTSIGAIDLSVVALDLVAVMPSEQLLGASVAGILVWGYLAAGIVSIAVDLMGVAE